MGLLNVIMESGIDFESIPLPKKSNVKSNSIELLKKYVKESSEARLDFFEFTKKYSLSTCAILELHDNEYVVSDCIGFDGISIIQTLSTADFWNGTIPSKNQWYRFSTSDSTITPFYQFLSFNLKEKVENIYIYFSAESSKILMICSIDEVDLTDDADLLEDFKLLKEEKPEEIDNSKIEISVDSVINKYSIDFEKAVKTFLALNLDNIDYLDYFKKIIYQVLWYQLNSYLNRHYYIYHTSESAFNFISFTKTQIEDKLFLQHLKKNLETILNDQADLVILHNLGTASSYSEITSFLKAE